MQELTVVMELKMLADVGLVGFPNAGKSTLVNAVSSAKPKIAGYPFTTLEPSVGVVSCRDNRSFVMADIPGIIEGASEGKGLGLRFLRHIERNALLLFMIPGDSDNIRHDYDVLLNELATYNPEMVQKRRVLAITKADLLDEELMQMLEAELPTDLPHLFISAVTGFHIPQLKDVLWNELNADAEALEARHPALVHRDKDIAYLHDELEAEGEDGNILVIDEDEADEDFDDLEFVEIEDEP